MRLQKIAIGFPFISIVALSLSALDTNYLAARDGYYPEYYSHVNVSNYDPFHDSYDREEMALKAYQSATEPTYKYYKGFTYHGTANTTYGSEEDKPYDPEDQWCTMVEGASSTLTVKENVIYSSGYSTTFRSQAYHIKAIRVTGEIANGKTEVDVYCDLQDFDYSAGTSAVTTKTYTKTLSLFTNSSSYYITMFSDVSCGTDHSVSEVSNSAGRLFH